MACSEALTVTDVSTNPRHTYHHFLSLFYYVENTRIHYRDPRENPVIFSSCLSNKTLIALISKKKKEKETE